MICCIYATAPFLRADNLIEGYRLLESSKELDFVFSATTYAFPIQRAFYLETKGNFVKMFQPEHANTRSQDLKEAYHDAGQFYWGRREAFFDKEDVFTAHSKPLLMPRDQVQDIDTLEDWDVAETKYKLLIDNNYFL